MAAWCFEKHLDLSAGPSVTTVDSLPWMINGTYQQSVSLENRGLHYGDGLFETLRVNNRVAINRAQHMRRLRNGLKTLRISASMELIENHLTKYLYDTNLPSLARLKVLVTRGEPATGYASSPAMQATIVIGAAPYSDIEESKRLAGVSLRFCSMRLSSNATLAGVKHLNRLEQVLARSEWQDDNVFEGLMFNSEGTIVEGTMSNLFLVNNTVLKTPKLDHSGVSGVMRGVIIEYIAPELGLVVEEQPVSRDDLCSADEVFISNSLIGALSVKQCEEYSWPVGPVCRAIHNAVIERENSAVYQQ